MAVSSILFLHGVSDRASTPFANYSCQTHENEKAIYSPSTGLILRQNLFRPVGYLIFVFLEPVTVGIIVVIGH